MRQHRGWDGENHLLLEKRESLVRILVKLHVRYGEVKRTGRQLLYEVRRTALAEVELYAGVLSAEERQHGRKNIRRMKITRAYRDVPALQLVSAAYIILKLVLQLSDNFHRFYIFFTEFRKPQRRRAPVEDRRARALLRFLYRQA